MKLRILILSLLLSCPVMLLAQGLDTANIDEAMGRSGQKTGDVFRLGFPRTDLHVSVAGVDIKPGLALGSWAAFLEATMTLWSWVTWFSWKMNSRRL
jgi:hypothetical protein